MLDDLLKLALMFIVDSRAQRSGGGSASRLTTGAVCTGCAVISVIAGVACAVAALWIYLVPIIGAAGAALAAAGIFLILSGTLMFVARNMFQPPAAAAVEEKAEPVVDDIVGMLRGGFERHKGASLLAALVAGLAAGSSNGR